MTIPTVAHPAAPLFPLSIKGVIPMDNKIILLKNERDEWELPGGRLEAGETPEDCVIREIREELSLRVRTVRLSDCWVYSIGPGKTVFIVAYLCALLGSGMPILSHEHKAIGLFSLAELQDLALPEGYRRSIAAAINPISI